MLIHLVADYGHRDLAFAEVQQRLALYLPEAALMATPVPAFDTISAGFCVAQLALTEGPERVVYHNVAPRADVSDPRPGNQGERLVVARLANGVSVIGANAGYTFSFVRDEAPALNEVLFSGAGSQFRSRDFFRNCWPASWTATSRWWVRGWRRPRCLPSPRGASSTSTATAT